MKIQTNTAANFALRNISANSQAAERSIQRLSSGFRINRAGDDAAGMAIANKFRAENRALGQAQKNAAQGTAMLQVMDGAVQTVSSILDRMKELATASNSASIGSQRDKLNSEFQKLAEEIDRIAQTTKYQGTALVDGNFGSFVDPTSTLLPNVGSVKLSGAEIGTTYTFTDTAGDVEVSATLANGQTITQEITGATAGATLNFDRVGITIELDAGYAAGDAAGTVIVDGADASFQVGSSENYASLDRIEVEAVNLRSSNLGVNALNIGTQAGAVTALTALDTAINTVNDAIGNIGAAQSRFDFASANVATTLQNSQAAESTIRDADMAYEMSQFTKSNILSQAAQAMLSQANQGSQGILQLLR